MFSLNFFKKKILQKLASKNLKAVLLLVFWSFVSRFLGIIRTALISGRFSPAEIDLFNASTGLNDFLNSTLILGSVSVSLLPQIVSFSNPNSEIDKQTEIDKQKKDLDKLEPKKETFILDQKNTLVQKNFLDLSTNFKENSQFFNKNLLENQQLQKLRIKLIKIEQEFNNLTDKNFKDGSKKNFRPQEKVNIYLSWYTLLLILTISTISLILIIWIEPILKFLNKDLFTSFYEQNKLTDYLNLNRLMLLAPIFFALKTIFRVFLNVKKEYKILSLEGVISNLGILFGLLIFYRFWGIKGISIGLIFGFALTSLIFIWQANYLGFSWNFQTFPDLKKGLINSLKLYLPRIFLINYMRLTENLMTLATKTADGQISALRLALDIQPTFFTIISAISVIFLPNLTELSFQKGEKEEFWQHLFKYIRITTLFAIFATILTIAGTPLFLRFLSLISFAKTNSLLQDHASLRAVWLFTFICSLALVFQAISEILQNYFIATCKNFVPVVASMTGNLAAIIITFGLAELLGSGLAVSLGFLVNTFLFCLILSVATYQNYLFFKKRL